MKGSYVFQPEDDEEPDYDKKRKKRDEHKTIHLKPGQFYLVQQFNSLATIKRKEEVHDYQEEKVSDEVITAQINTFYQTSQSIPNRFTYRV